MYYQLRAFVFTLLTIVILGGTVGSAFAAVGGRPANYNAQNPRSNSWFIYNLNPGDTVQDTVEVVNSSIEAKRIAVYATDSLIASGGSFSCDQKADPVDETGSWIRLASSTITLAPGQTGTVNFSLSVPGNADVGEHSACIVIQDVDQIPQDTVNGVQLSTRSAVRVYVTVPGEIIRQLQISGFSAKQDFERGVVSLRPKIQNTGNVSVDTRLDVRVRNIIGISSYRHEGLYTVARSEETEWNFELKRPFWGGFYAANFTAAYDPNPDTQLGIELDREKTVLRSQTIWFFSKPTLLGGIAWMLLILLAVIAYNMYRKHRATMEWIKESWVNHTVAAGEDLTALGARYKIDWRIIAQANNLQPPYGLQVGQKLLVPPPVLSRQDKASVPVKIVAKKTKTLTPAKSKSRPKAKPKSATKKKK